MFNLLELKRWDRWTRWLIRYSTFSSSSSNSRHYRSFSSNSSRITRYTSRNRPKISKTRIFSNKKSQTTCKIVKIMKKITLNLKLCLFNKEEKKDILFKIKEIGVKRLKGMILKRPAILSHQNLEVTFLIHIQLQVRRNLQYFDHLQFVRKS